MSFLFWACLPTYVEANNCFLVLQRSKTRKTLSILDNHANQAKFHWFSPTRAPFLCRRRQITVKVECDVVGIARMRESRQTGQGSK